MKLSGDLVYLDGFGKSIVIINSPDIAYELFEKRSSLYSDRFALPMINDLYVCLLPATLGGPDWCRMGWDWLTTFKPYGEGWRNHRKMIHAKFHPRAATEYQPIQLKHARFTALSFF